MDKFNFGNKICELRTQQKLTQKQLASYLGVSDKAVSKWENGEAMPRVATMKALAECLGTSYSDLLSDEKEAKTYPPYELYHKKVLDNCKRSVESFDYAAPFFTFLGALLLLVAVILFIVLNRFDNPFRSTGVILSFLVSTVCSVYYTLFHKKKVNLATIQPNDLKKPIVISTLTVLSCIFQIILSIGFCMDTLYMVAPLIFMLICDAFFCFFTYGKHKLSMSFYKQAPIVMAFLMGAVLTVFLLLQINYSTFKTANITNSDTYIQYTINFLICCFFGIGAPIHSLIVSLRYVDVIRYIFCRDNPQDLKETDTKKAAKIFFTVSKIGLGAWCIYLAVLGVWFATYYMENESMEYNGATYERTQTLPDTFIPFACMEDKNKIEIDEKHNANKSDINANFICNKNHSLAHIHYQKIGVEIPELIDNAEKAEYMFFKANGKKFEIKDKAQMQVLLDYFTSADILKFRENSDISPSEQGILFFARSEYYGGLYYIPDNLHCEFTDGKLIVRNESESRIAPNEINKIISEILKTENRE